MACFPSLWKARRLFKALPGYEVGVFWGWCGEHVGNTLSEKVRAIYPWIRDSIRDVRKVTVFQSRKKTLKSYCRQVIKTSQTERKISLRRPRSTRFCSNHTSAAGLLYNLETLRRGTAQAGVRDPRFTAAVSGSKSSAKKADEFVDMIHSNSRAHAVGRVLAILQPVTK